MTVRVPRPSKREGSDGQSSPRQKDVEYIRAQLARFSFATVSEQGGEFHCGHRQVSRVAVEWLQARGELVLASRTWGSPPADS